MKSEPKRYAEREREALMQFALSVALDPSSSAEDVAAATRTLSRPDDEQVKAMFAAHPYWVLAGLRALLDESDPRRERMRALLESSEWAP